MQPKCDVCVKACYVYVCMCVLRVCMFVVIENANYVYVYYTIKMLIIYFMYGDL
jgi:hypothetical protein